MYVFSQMMASPNPRQTVVHVETSPWSVRKRASDIAFDSDYSEG